MQSSKRKIGDFVRSPAGLLAALVLGVLFMLPSLQMGFFLDDYAQIALMEEWYPKDADLFNLYSFLGDLPLDNPWWKHPEFKVSMWRPLASALLRLDNALYGHDAALYHLESIFWFALQLGAVVLLYRRILPPRLAVLALLIFALDESHTLAAGWIANRYAVLAVIPSLAAVWAHLRWREDGWRPGLPLSVAGFAAGLLCGEVALSVMAYVGAYELLALLSPERRRPAALVPLAVVGACYTVWYKIGHFGAAKSGFYLDPTGEPLAFLAGAAGHVPALMAAALLGMPSEMWFFAPGLRPVQVVVGTVAVTLFAGVTLLVWRRLEPELRRPLGWLLLGAALGLVPAAVPQPFDRVLVAPMIGIAVWLAVLLDFAWRRGRELARERRTRRFFVFAAAGALAFLHLLLPPVGRVASLRFMGREWADLYDRAGRLPFDPATAAQQNVMVLTAPDIVVGGFFPLMYGMRYGTSFASWTPLSLAPYDHEFSRTDPRTLEARLPTGQMLASPPELFHRSPAYPLAPGDVVTTPELTVEVLEVNDRGPTRVAFRFARDPEAGDVTFLVWRGTELVPVVLPPVGEVLRVPASPGPMETAMKNLTPF